MTRFRAAVSNPLALIAILVAATLLPPLASPASAFHFPWDQGHDTFSPTTPPDPGLCKSSTCNQCSLRSPVYVPTGHFFWSDTDVVLRGRPYMGITRTYNSNDPRTGLFGNGWSVGCDVGLYVTTSGSEMHFVYRAPDGKRYEYVVQPDGTVTSPPGRFEQVLPQPDGTVQILYLDNTRQVFRADGRLAATLDANDNRVNYTYDASDRLVSIADTNGRSLNFTYNASGRVSRVTDHGGRVWQYDYDIDGNLVAVTDPLAGVRRYEYRTFTPDGGDVTYHQLTKITDASGVVVTQVVYNGERVESYTEGENRFSYTYNPSAKTVTKVDSMTSQWVFVHNDGGLVTEETDPLGHRITRVFDVNGRETNRTDQIGGVWTSTYDSLGRTLRAVNPLAETTVLDYAGTNPAPVRITSPSGRVSGATYDARLNPLTATAPTTGTTAFEWGSSGDLVGSVDALGNRTSFVYTPIGLPAMITDPLLRVWRFSYDALGRSTTFQNPAGEVTTKAYDSMDRVVQTMDPLGNKTSYVYDATGRLKSVTDARGYVTKFDHDAFGRLVRTTSPDGSVRRIDYQVDNLPQRITLPDLRTIEYSYDAAGRLIREGAGGETTIFSYSSRNELIGGTGPGGTVSFAYDAVGRLVQEQSSGQIVQSTLNSEGERVVLTALGVTTSYSRDAGGLITSIATPAGPIGLAYDALGRRRQLNLPNVARTDYGYDASGQLVSLAHAGPFAATYGYVFDTAGRIVRQSGDGAEWDYTYDAAGRLVGANHGTSSAAYGYDAVGNLLGKSQMYDTANRLVEDAASRYSYDPNGNLTRKEAKSSGARADYSWNAKGQLQRVERFANSTATTPTTTLFFTYDPLGRLASRSQDGVVERYGYDGLDAIGVLDSVGNVATARTFGPYIDEPLYQERRMAGFSEAFQANHLGSVVALTSQTAIVSQYSYDAYGVTNATVDGLNRIKYAGREQHADDLYDYRARFYDPTIGRFISEDPIGMAGGGNLYSYVQGNPVSYRDPFGLVKVKVGGYVITVHKNDPDPFPSSPHGHLYPSAAKVDVHTGDIVQGSKTIGRLNPKHLAQLRGALKKAGILGLAIAVAIQANDAYAADCGQFGSHSKEAIGGAVGGFAGGWAGAATGAYLGATIGSVVPGLGTAIGGFAGGLIGGIVGSSVGEEAGVSFVERQF